MMPTSSPSARSANPEKLSREEISQLYSETIKLSMDNKINAKNTWTLPLIDYMGMLVQGNEDGDNSHTPTTAARLSSETTNFQLAGVTLDAGVRIYCSRVDSVHSNAFKVLGGLSRTKGGDDDDDVENEEDDGLDANGKKKNRRPRGGATLVSNLSSVTVRKLETDLAVDPLFQKMSEAFDDGSAEGMLANRLFVAPSGYILFDSAESATINAEEEKNPGETYDPAEDVATFSTPTQLCPEFMSYVSAKNISEEAPVENSAATDADSDMGTAVGAGMGPSMDDVQFEYEDGDANIGNDGGGFVAPIGDIGDDDHDAFDEDPGADVDPDDFEMAPYDPATRNSDPVVPGGGVDLVEAGVELCPSSEYTFFDAASLSAWAGPQHWTFRKKARKTRAPADGTGGARAKRPRSKMAMLLDYSEDAPVVDLKTEFHRHRNKTGNQISAEGLSEKKTTLPVDLHYTTRDLTTLSLLPAMRVAIGGTQGNGDQTINTPIADAGGAGPWYDYDNDMDADNFVADDGDIGGDIDLNALGPDVDNVSTVTDMLGAGLNLVAAPDKVERLDIGYATVAKKVDVRKLKSGLWSHLCGGAEEGEADGVEPEAAEESQKPECDIRKGGGIKQNLSEVVHEMPNYVPERALTDVTFPYVFICLLHLANEKTLKIETTDDALRDIVIARDVE